MNQTSMDNKEHWFDIVFAATFAIMMASGFAASEPSNNQEIYLVMLVASMLFIPILMVVSIIFEEKGWM